jgi:GDP-L-fucose synthase
MIKKGDPIYLAGHKGLLGSAIYKKLKEKGYKNIIIRTRSQLDLTDQKKTFKFITKFKPRLIIIAAAYVGGIKANDQFKAEFIYNNLMIQSNIIHSAFLNNIKNLIFFGSSCAYPKFSKQPIKEAYLLNGYLEKTNEPYAVAKISGIKMCESYNSQYSLNYKCLMPCNTFGPNDNYDLETSHFLPAIIRKVHEIKLNKNKNLIIWGDGKVRRELLYVDDIADACIFFMNKKIRETLINIGRGRDSTINKYIKIIKKIILPNKKFKIIYDHTKPKGTKQKLLDISLAKKYGWRPKFDLEESIRKTYKAYLNSMN